MALRQWRRVSLIVGVLLALMLGGCPVPPPVPHQHVPQEKQVQSSRTAAAAYHCAATLFARQPGVAHFSSDATTHVIRGEWHRAVDMVLTVDPLPSSSRITIAGSVPPHRQVTGTFDEVDTLAALLQQHCA
jgi:hypothetical protein